TATSFGPRRKPARQRAAKMSNAVESGPPDTASARTGDCARSPNSAAASAEETGSAAGTLLFSLHALLHGRAGAGILESHLQEGGARRLLLLQGGQRLPEPHQRFRSLARFLVLGGDVEIGFGGLAIALALEQALAQPVIGLRGEPVVGVLAQE